MASINPRKQRLIWYEADQRTHHRMMAAPLSKELRQKHKTRALPLRVGDTVKVARGDYKGKTGNVTQVDSKRNKVFLQGFTHKKTDGKEAFVGFKPSNLLVTGMDGKDKRRLSHAKRGKAPATETKGKGISSINKKEKPSVPNKDESRTMIPNPLITEGKRE
ncbi:MAG: 50S ribosomal protein L24 [Candidatus Diapherotrites archaeon]|nr:50S ribosomal protein L24 [Candidatus Diapherotrites archaeon]MDZ4256390.1 50S ribosomal protein L24 [archaeon]